MLTLSCKFQILLVRFPSVPLSWQQQRTNIESAKLLSPRNSISALNKCKDTHIFIYSVSLHNAHVYILPSPSTKIKTEYKHVS